MLWITVIDFEASELGIFYSNVKTYHRQGDNMRFVGFKWTRNCKLILGVTVHNVNKLLFFNRANHNRAAFGIRSNVFPWHNSAGACFSESFLVDLDKAFVLKIIVQDYDAARI